MQTNLDEIKEGAIFSHSWGYDQTNYDFYQVVKRMKSSVIVRQINSQAIQKDGYQMTSTVVPMKDNFQNEAPMTKRLKLSYDQTPCLRMEYGYCKLWDGQPKHATHYA